MDQDTPGLEGTFDTVNTVVMTPTGPLVVLVTVTAGGRLGTLVAGLEVMVTVDPEILVGRGPKEGGKPSGGMMGEANVVVIAIVLD